MTYYTKDHEWLTCDGQIATVGITQHAADALGDLVFVEVKTVGTQLVAEDVAAIVESVKAASDIYAPVAGTVVEVNPQIVEDPAIVNSDPEGRGWLLKLKLENVSELAGLMDRSGYDELVANS